MVNKIIPYIDQNYWLKSLELINKISIKLPKVLNISLKDF